MDIFWSTCTFIGMSMKVVKNAYLVFYWPIKSMTNFIVINFS